MKGICYLNANHTIEFVDDLFVLRLVTQYEDKLWIFVLTMEDDKNLEALLELNHQLTALQKVEMKERLTVYINNLLLHDFNKLVQILYTVDVSETKLKDLLRQNPDTDAAVIISDLLMQRQEEKLKSKEAFKSNGNIPDEEKW